MPNHDEIHEARMRTQRAWGIACWGHFPLFAIVSVGQGYPWHHYFTSSLLLMIYFGMIAVIGMITLPAFLGRPPSTTRSRAMPSAEDRQAAASGQQSRPRTFEWARQAAAREVRPRLDEYVGSMDSLPAPMRSQVADKAVAAAETKIINAILNGLGSERKKAQLMSLLERNEDTAGFLAQNGIDVEHLVRTELASFKSECEDKFGLR